MRTPGFRTEAEPMALWYIHMFTLFSAWSLQTFFATKLVFMYILYTLGRRDVRSSCTFEDKNVNISWTGVIFLVTSVSCWIPYLSCSPKSGDRGNSITVQFVLFKKPEAGPCPPVPAPPFRFYVRSFDLSKVTFSYESATGASYPLYSIYISALLYIYIKNTLCTMPLWVSMASNFRTKKTSLYFEAMCL